MRRSPSALLSLCNSSTFKHLITILCILIFTTLSFAAAPDRITSPVVSSQLIRLSAGVPMRAQPQYDQGRVEPSLKLNYMTLLTVPSASQQKALDQLLAQQQDPHSPLYHKWLTPEQYADRFGLSPNDIQKLTTWLQSQGFSVHNVARGRNWIVFSGTAAQAENTFQTEIHNFSVDGKTRFSNTTPASIPAALSGVVSGIRGLSNFPLKSHLQRRKPAYTFPGFPVSSDNIFLAPGDIETIYDIGPLYTAGIDGTGQTMAVMGETDVYLDDLANFRSGFGLSAISPGCATNSSGVITACDATNLKYVLVDATDPGAPNSIQDDLMEADADIELSGATAPNAQIIYVNAPDKNGNGVWDSWYYAVDNTVSPVIAMSYGVCELTEAQYGASFPGQEGSFSSDETELKKANSEGITFVNSSGDSGAAGCDPNPTDPTPATLATGGLAVSYPASSPEVTGVGGTMIPYSEYTGTYWNTSNNANGNGGSAIKYIPEGAWNDAFEIGAFCAANPTDTFCTDYGVTNAQTAQAEFGIGSTGGGPSNCTTLNISGDCTGGFTQPSWQTVTIPSQASARFVPDVSLLASPGLPGYIFCTQLSELSPDTGTGSSCAPGGANGIVNALSLFPISSFVGGTSASAQIFGGMVVLLNQYLVKNGVQSAPGLGNINPNLYQIASANPAAFHQLTFTDYPAAAPTPLSNEVYCSPGTPGVPPGLPQCPLAVAPATEELFGYLSANADHATGYNLVTGLGSVDLNELATVWESSKSASSITITALPTSIYLGQSVTLTATVSASSPTGQVNFFNNGSATAFGTGTLNSSGVATLSTTSLPVGTDDVTATYVGDVYNQPSTTATPAVVTVAAPTLTWTTTSTSHTVLAGQTTLAYNFLATPTGTTTFTAQVTFSCSFSPADSTLTNSSCVFTPASIAAGTPSTGTAVSMTITTAGPNTGTGADLRRRADNRSPWLPWTLPIAGVVMLGLMRGKVSRKVSKHSAIAVLCFSLALLGFMVACGGGSSSTLPVSVTVTPGTTVNLYADEAGNAWPTSATQQQFSATVNNSSNQTVTWAVTGGSANGTITSAGLYTSPATVPSPATVTVTATPTAATAPGSGTVDILTPTGNGALPATYKVTVTATEGGVTPESQQVTLVVD
ncbi:MAG: protease pro-enzyme activation domain-containing protein [Terriglobia bacterium]